MAHGPGTQLQCQCGLASPGFEQEAAGETGKQSRSGRVPPLPGFPFNALQGCSVAGGSIR